MSDRAFWALGVGWGSGLVIGFPRLGAGLELGLTHRCPLWPPSDGNYIQQEPCRMGPVVHDIALVELLVDRLMHHGEVYYLKG